MIRPLERLRRWGLLCNCHEQVRAARRSAGKHFIREECDFNGRRLREVPAKIDSVVQEFRLSASRLSAEDCENDGNLHTGITSSLRLAAEELLTRTKYIRSIPWAFVWADTVDGAKKCIEQFDALPASSHDSTSVEIMAELGSDIRARAAGHSASEALQEECLALANSSLDESAGEGYHRNTNLVRLHCPSAKSPYIKQRVRLKENIRICKNFLKKHQAKGRAVIRFEWAHYKRILQNCARKRWKPVLMSNRKFFLRVYHMDELSLVDWSPYVLKSGLVQLPDPSKETWADEMAREYLSAVFKPLTYYSYCETQDILHCSPFHFPFLLLGLFRIYFDTRPVTLHDK